MTPFTFRSALAASAIAAFLGACTPLSSSVPAVATWLQTASAGHTGCLPEANDLSNVKFDLAGNGLWNATCKGRTYLCSAVSSASSNSESISCAPVAE
jgi:hypothetical protein